MNSALFRSCRGFTLVEIMITIAVSGILMAGVYTVFISQQNSYLAQEQVAEMQQNIRSAVDLMTRDIRMAGFDPYSSANTGIVTATAGRFGFTFDENQDGLLAANEAMTYGFSAAFDADFDGVVDAGTAPLGSNIGTATGVGGGGFQPIAEEFQAIEFNYVLFNGTVTTSPNTNQLPQIRSVEISILARARQLDRNFNDVGTYTTASGAVWGPFNDQFRRRFQIITVQLRNMGM